MSRTYLLLVLLTVPGGWSLGTQDLEHINLGAILSTLSMIPGPALQATYNRGLDAVLEFINAETVKEGRTEISLPDIEEGFSKKILFARIRGTVSADHGVIGDLGTVKRMGDTMIEQVGDDYKVTVVVGLGTVRVRYGHYLAKLGRRGPSVSGHLNGHLGDNAIRASATVSFKGADCAVVLNEVKVVTFEGLGIEVRGSGLGVLNWILTSFANQFAGNNRGNIIRNIEEGLSKLGTKALAKIHCDPNQTS